jgi:lipopolysaccharide/colanic/teichoic acid biosynthesis glycosyltransferase
MMETKLLRSTGEAIQTIPRAMVIGDYYFVGTAAVSEPLLKRPFDFVLAGLGLLLSAWLWILISIVIIIEDGFPILIRQHRIGRGGGWFFSYKFRSMRRSALAERVNNQAKEDDPRITRVGRFLRNCALDELPQLINIMRGDMSFVGPRALLPNEIEVNGDARKIRIEDIPGYEQRITVRPGLTGIAQIFAPRDIMRRQKFKYDLLYIKKMGLFYDLRLIIISFLVTLGGCWEKRGTKISLLQRKNHQTNGCLTLTNNAQSL